MEHKHRNQTCYILYGEPARAQRILRDFTEEALDRIWVNSRLTHVLLLEFIDQYFPEMTGKRKYYTGKKPIFDLYNVENKMQRSLERKIELKFGGYLIIDQTTAMTNIDINMDAFVVRRHLNKTIFNPNIKATQVIAHQRRLRNLVSIIIIDFIYMGNWEYRQRVLPFP